MPARVILQDFTGVPAVVDLASMRAAVKRLGGRPAADQPARPRRPRRRPLGAGGRVRLARRPAAERRDRVRAQPRALRVPALGPEGLRQLPRGAARDRHRPPGEPRVPGEGVVLQVRGRRDGRHARHARRHRLAHHDDQRPRRPRLGRRRDRGRGGHARPAALHGDPAGRRLPPRGQAPRGHDRDRPRPHRHPDAPQEGRRREVRGVLRPRARRDEPRRPRHDRQHGPRVRGHLRLLPGRRRDARLPPQDGPQPGRGRPRRALLEGAGSLPDRRDTRARLHRHARARPRDGRAEPRRAEAAARPRGPLRDEGVVPQGPHGAGQGARLRPRPGGRREGGGLRGARAEGRAPATARS